MAITYDSQRERILRRNGDRPAHVDCRVMNAWSSAVEAVARHPVLAFMLISLGLAL